MTLPWQLAVALVAPGLALAPILTLSSVVDPAPRRRGGADAGLYVAEFGERGGPGRAPRPPPASSLTPPTPARVSPSRWPRRAAARWPPAAFGSLTPRFQHGKGFETMAVRVGINGFGRIGRNVFRAAHESGADVEIVAVNDITDRRHAGHLLKYDSVFGPFPGEVSVGDGALIVNGSEVKVLAERDPAALPWGDLGVDVVIESTGFFTKRADAAKHLEARRQEGHHLRARDRAGRDRRPRRQLRRGLRRRQPPRHLQRVVHDELPRAGRQGPQRPGRHREGPDDDDPRLHGRSAPPGRAAQGPAPRPRRRDQPRPRLDRRRQGDRPRDPRAQRQAQRLRGARPRPDRLGRRPHDRLRARHDQVEEINEAFKAQADTGAFEGILALHRRAARLLGHRRRPALLDLRLAS